MQDRQAPFSLSRHKVILLVPVLVMLAMGGFASHAVESPVSSGGFPVLSGEIEGPITPATEDILRAMLIEAEEGGAKAILIRLDTPGGLVSSMRTMIKSMLASPLPIVVWVGPSGARAASAGVFLVAASHVAAMAPQTTIGAASPVSMQGKDIDKTMQAKIKNDIMSFVRGIAASRGRNSQWYEQSVDEAVSVSAAEAAMLNVVEVIARDRTDLFEQLAIRGISFDGVAIGFEPSEVRFVEFDAGMRYRLLAWLLNPQIAYLLLLGGLAGLFFEFSTPGAVFPGVFGGLCLILGLYALSVLPTNAAGVLLILFALVLLVLEVYVTSFGMLGIAAMASLFFGSTILFDPSSGLAGLPLSLILSTIIPLSLLLGGCLVVITRAHRSRPASGLNAMTGETALVRSWQGKEGKVFVRGELWKAQSVEDLHEAASVRIVEVRGLTLLVEALQESDSAPKED